jgi:hypothetical protein
MGAIQLIEKLVAKKGETGYFRLHTLDYKRTLKYKGD